MKASHILQASLLGDLATYSRQVPGWEAGAHKPSLLHGEGWDALLMQEVGLYEHRHPGWGWRASSIERMVDLGQADKKEANFRRLWRAGICDFYIRIWYIYMKLQVWMIRDEEQGWMRIFRSRSPFTRVTMWYMLEQMTDSWSTPKITPRFVFVHEDLWRREWRSRLY